MKKKAFRISNGSLEFKVSNIRSENKRLFMAQLHEIFEKAEPFGVKELFQEPSVSKGITRIPTRHKVFTTGVGGFTCVINEHTGYGRTCAAVCIHRFLSATATRTDESYSRSFAKCAKCPMLSAWAENYEKEE